MKRNYLKRVTEQTPTRFWINNVTRREADCAIEAGARGCTQNPSYVWKILNSSEDKDYASETIKTKFAEYSNDNELLCWTQRELVSGIAKKFLPIFEASHGAEGFVSIQGDPFHEDTESIVRYARFNREAGPNIMAKVPVTEEGLKAIEVLIKEGVPINATECMAIRQVIDVCELYVKVSGGMANPAPLYFSLITGIYDEYLHKHVAANNIDVCPDTLWQAGVSIAKKVHEIVNFRRYPCGFIGGGARGLHHFTEMVGGNANITINWVGTADKLIEQDAPVVCRFLQPTPHEVIDTLSEKLEDYRKAYYIHAIEPHEYEEFGPVALFRSTFEDGWEKALIYIKNFRESN
ncbi:MAG: hypothetical protein LBQ73_11445 [Tannerellaceae bacterium]|jgi:transaldolase|nr:hypothetical protein [Tannerellaceae bacterium]